MKTMNTSLGEYAIVQEPDFQAIFSMTENCKGVRKASHYEEDAKLCPSFYSKMKKRKRTVLYASDDLEKIIAAKDSKSTVTMEAILAANGMMPLKHLNSVLFALKPEKKDVQDLRRREYAQPQFVHCDYYPDDKERFMKDISFFSSALPSEEILNISKHLEDIFSDKALVKMLYKYHKHKSQELADMKEVLSGDKNSCSPISEYYKGTILELIHSLDEQERISEPEAVTELTEEEIMTEKEPSNTNFCDFGNGLASLCTPKK